MRLVQSLFVQTINILVVNQSVIDMCGSFFALLSNVIEVNGYRMSRGSVYDQFVCRIWISAVPVWSFLFMSTIAILITALERYIAVIYPVWYKVRINDYYSSVTPIKCTLWDRKNMCVKFYYNCM